MHEDGSISLLKILSRSNDSAKTGFPHSIKKKRFLVYLTGNSQNSSKMPPIQAPTGAVIKKNAADKIARSLPGNNRNAMRGEGISSKGWEVHAELMVNFNME